MIDLTRRRFLFGLAAVPLLVPAVKHFVLPKPIEPMFAVNFRGTPPSALTWEMVVRAKELARRNGKAADQDQRPNLCRPDTTVTNRRT